MKLARRQLVDEVMARLRTLDTIQGVVFEDPAKPVEDALLPMAIVEVEEERSEVIDPTLASPSGTQLLNTLVLSISAVAKTPEQRDAISQDIHINIAVDWPTQNPADRITITYVRTDFGDNADGAFRFWTATAQYQFEFEVLADQPFQIIREA